MTQFPLLTQLSDRGKGILMAIGGVLVLSPDSLLIRLAGLDDYTLLFYRGLFPAARRVHFSPCTALSEASLGYAVFWFGECSGKRGVGMGSWHEADGKTA